MAGSIDTFQSILMRIHDHVDMIPVVHPEDTAVEKIANLLDSGKLHLGLGASVTKTLADLLRAVSRLLRSDHPGVETLKKIERAVFSFDGCDKTGELNKAFTAGLLPQGTRDVVVSDVGEDSD